MNYRKAIFSDLNDISYLVTNLLGTCNINKNSINVSKIDILNGNKKLCVLKTESTIELRESKRSLYYLKSENTSTIAIKAFANKELKTIIKVEGETKND